MKADHDEEIVLFFKAAAVLKKLKVIRSARYLGDIGEFICTQRYPKLKLN